MAVKWKIGYVFTYFYGTDAERIAFTDMSVGDKFKTTDTLKKYEYTGLAWMLDEEEVSISGTSLCTTTNVTGATAISTTLKPGASFRLHEIRIHLSAAGGAGNFTAIMDAGAGTAYDLEIIKQDMTSVTDLVWQFDTPMQFSATDEIDFAWENAGTKNYGLTIVYSLL